MNQSTTHGNSRRPCTAAHTSAESEWTPSAKHFGRSARRPKPEKIHSADVWGLSPTNSLLATRTVLTFIDGHTRIFIISIKYEALGCLRDLYCLGSDAARSAFNRGVSLS